MTPKKIRVVAWASLILALTCGPLYSQPRKPDVTPHKIQFLTVDKDVTLEVLDWGGSGPPLLFLTGWGSTAHVFDSFATKFLNKHHVYGITRRGFGQSSKPPPTLENYDSERLADDVLAVMDTLKLDRPVLAGHSTAGQEMSSIGTRYPEKVSGLIYLDAAYALAYYAPNGGYTVQVEADTMRRDLEKLMRVDANPEAIRKVIAEIQKNIPNLQHSLERSMATIEGWPQPEVDITDTPDGQRAGALMAGRHKYTDIKPPILAIIAVPYNCKPNCDKPDQKAWGEEMAAQANAFEKGNPSARVVRLPYADHFIFRSNPVEVEKEMNAFMDSLKKN